MPVKSRFHAHSGRDHEHWGHATPLLDDHGFPVPEQFASLLEEFAPVWQKEEGERERSWSQFFEALDATLPVDLGQEEALSDLLHSDPATIQPSRARLLQQLRSLVHAGLPQVSS
jgi:hypothetical protein